MNRMRNVLWGLVFIALAVVLGLNAMEITDINLFFDGWWTLFIIVPCAIELFKSRGKMGNIIGLFIGVILLLACQNVVDMRMLGKLVVPAILLIIGLAFIFRDAFNGNAIKRIKELRKNKTGSNTCFATFSSQKTGFDGQDFKGGEFTAVFGSVECDLRGAIISEDIVVEADAIFGGIEIYLPDNVNVKIRSTSLFGGVSEKTVHHPIAEAPTVYINAVCLFGGVDLK